MKELTIEEMYRYAQYVHKAGMQRNTIKSPEMAFCVIAYGQEVGVSPMAAINGITFKGVIPTIDGDLLLALVRKSGELDFIDETLDEKTKVARCYVRRKGCPGEPRCSEFSWDDAVKAGLTGKDNWKKFPNRMLRYRALG